MNDSQFWFLVLIACLSFTLSVVGATSGLILGQLRLPLLITFLRSPVAGAMMNLIVSGTGAFGGTIRHLRDGRVSLSGLMLMGIPSAIGAIIAVLVFVRMTPVWSYLIIGVMLVYSGFRLLHKGEDRSTGEPISLVRRVIIEIVVGVVLGALAAITGLMMGSLRLTTMIRHLKMDPKVAIGTNMAVGCLTALVGSVTGLLLGAGQLHCLVLLVVVPPTILGGYLGGWLTGRLSKDGVRRLAGWLVTFSGIILFGQGLKGTFHHPHKTNCRDLVNPAEPESAYPLIDAIADEIESHLPEDDSANGNE